ncbi:MAG: hypothetical protein KUG81_04250, partial [Gammaproteobacteria bacterium]|nr:hypothetical protein [Gammaproteobacteria bacterium]
GGGDKLVELSCLDERLVQGYIRVRRTVGGEALPFIAQVSSQPLHLGEQLENEVLRARALHSGSNGHFRLGLRKGTYRLFFQPNQTVSGGHQIARSWTKSTVVEVGDEGQVEAIALEVLLPEAGPVAIVLGRVEGIAAGGEARLRMRYDEPGPGQQYIDVEPRPSGDFTLRVDLSLVEGNYIQVSWAKKSDGGDLGTKRLVPGLQEWVFHYEGE